MSADAARASGATRARDARARDESAAIALLLTGVLLVWSLGHGLAAAWNGLPGAAERAQPLLALAVHVCFWIYAGGLHGPRRATWIALIVGGAALQLFGFLDYLLPRGQMSFWAAAQAPWLRPLLEWLDGGGAVASGLVVPGLLALDLWMAHRRLAWRTPWRRAVGPLLLLVLAGYLALGLATRCPEPGAFTGVAELRATVECGVVRGSPFGVPGTGGALFAPAHIVPEWNVLPFYAVLRATPGKEAGVVAMVALLLAPALAAWFGAERWRAGRAAPLWLGACLSALTATVALGWLGAQPAEEPWLLASRILALYVAAFLVIPLLARLR